MAPTPPGTGANGFSVALADASDDVVVSVSGELDILTAPVLERYLSTAVDRAPRRVVVDLGRVTFLDLRAINVLVEARQRIGAEGPDLVLRAPSAKVRRLIAMCGLDHLLAEG
jgi:anti-sigma B factor antagonist